MTVGCYSLAQVIAPIANAMLDVVCLRDQVNMPSGIGMWYLI